MKNQYAKTFLGSLSLKLLRSSIILELSENPRSTEGLLPLVYKAHYRKLLPHPSANALAGQFLTG